MEAWVVGGGRSAEGCRPSGMVVACHQAQRALEEPPLFALSPDWVWWRDNTAREGTTGVWVDLGDAPEGIDLHERALRFRAVRGGLWAHEWSDDLADGVTVAGSSGVAAMSFAYLLGARRITLAGIDLDGDDGRPWQRWREGFDFAARELRRRGVEVVSVGKWQPPAS